MTEMKTTIYKYDIPLEGEFYIKMPRDAGLLHAAVQHGHPRLWVRVTPSNPIVRRRFILIGTGQPAPNQYEQSGKHLGTFMLNGGDLVLHLFCVDEGYDD